MKNETSHDREITICQTPDMVTERLGFCNCCGKKVILLTDEGLGESICKICHSYDVRRAA